MPVISNFFGIIVRMFYDEHNPPHILLNIKIEKLSLIFLEIY